MSVTRQAGDPGEDGIPNAEFDLQQDLSEAVATHAGPEPVPADELEVAVYTGRGTDLVESSRKPTRRQFADEYDVVEEGDSMAFAPDDDGELSVEWVHPEADDRLPLGSIEYDA